MATSKAVIKAALVSLCNDMGTGDGLTIDQYSDRMAVIVQDAIRSGSVSTTVAAPIPVQVVPATGTGATTGPGTGTGTIL